MYYRHTYIHLTYMSTFIWSFGVFKSKRNNDYVGLEHGRGNIYFINKFIRHWDAEPSFWSEHHI